MNRFFLPFLLILCLVSCRRTSRDYDYVVVDRDTLYKRIVQNYDVEAYGLYIMHFDPDTLRFISIVLADSAHYWQAYGNIYFGNALAKTPMSDTIVTFYTMKWCAYGGIEDKDIDKLFTFKDDLYNWLNDYTFEWGPSVWNKDLYASEYNNIDSVISVICRTADTTSYLKLRMISNANQLLPIAVKMADEVRYPPAMFDAYRCYVAVYGSRYEMNSVQTIVAERYLDMGVSVGFLPCIWKKSLQLLTGTYTSQDTIKGKHLFQQCVNNADTIPFWRVEL